MRHDGAAAAAAEAVAATGANPGNRRGSACERLAKEAHSGGGFVLAEHDRLPVVLAGDRILVFLAQEADFVGLDERLDVGRVGFEFAVVELNGAAVLHAAMKGFEVAVALDGAGNFGRGDGEREGEERHEEDGDEHDVALLGGGDGLASAM